MAVYDMRSRSNPIGDFLQQWMQNTQRDEELSRQEAQRQQEIAARAEQQKYAALADQFSRMTPAQQAALYPHLPPGAREYVPDPALVPANPWDTVSQKHGEFAAGIDPATMPPEFIASEIHQNNVGAALPSATNNSIVRRSAMSPEDFNEGQRKGYIEPTPQQEALIPYQQEEIEARTAATEDLGEQRRARTDEIREPTTVKPPAPGRQPAQAKAAPSAAQKQIEDYNRQLRQLSDREMKAIADFNAATAGKDKGAIAKAKAIMETTRQQIGRLKNRRDTLIRGAEKAGAIPAAAPADGKTITRSELEALGASKEEAEAEGLTVID